MPPRPGVTTPNSNQMKSRRRTSEGLTEEQIKAKKEEKALRVRFDQYDNNPKDGKLDFAEFKIAMNKIAGTELKDDVIQAAFDKVDLDGNGGIDFEEFQKGYKLIEQYAKDKPAQTVDKALDLAKAVNPAASVAAGMVKTLSDNVKVDIKTTTEPTETTALNSQAGGSGEPQAVEVLSDGDAWKAQAALSGVMSIAVCAVACMMLIFAAPAIMFWIAVGSGESCDVPLDTWCWGMAISTTLGLLITIFQTSRAANAQQNAGEGFMALGANTQPGYDANSGPMGCISLFNFVWTIIGLYWFAQSGFFAGGSGNCEKVAPTVFTIVWWYWLLTFIIIPAALVLCCCFCICMALMGGSIASMSMKGQRS